MAGLGLQGTRGSGQRAPGASALVAIALIAWLVAPGSEPAAAGIGDGVRGVKAKLIAKFDSPLHVTRAPGRKHRKLMFVTEQEGYVRVLRGNRAKRRPFLNIVDQVRSGGEEGMLSIAFDPDYSQNRRFYAYLTDNNGDIRINQYRARRGSKLRASPKPRRVIVVPHPDAGNHNGGTVAFGRDRYLYIGTGDGGGSCDPRENAQDPQSLLGKLLRIDPKLKRGYRVPKGNPFVGSAPRDEIYADGLRNPFRFSFDPAADAIAIGDVGQNDVEEINYETLQTARGANFGWNSYEGSGLVGGACGFDAAPPPPDHHPPIHEYRHSGPGHTGCSVTGGIVVRDRALISLYGRYLYADFCTSQLRSLIPELGGARDERALGLDIPNPTSFASLRAKRVYVTSIDGGLYRLKPAR